jgi:hypothetical protein
MCRWTVVFGYYHVVFRHRVVIHFVVIVLFGFIMLVDLCLSAPILCFALILFSQLLSVYEYIFFIGLASPRLLLTAYQVVGLSRVVVPCLVLFFRFH